MFLFRPKLKGMIGYLGLEKFWYSLSDSEQKRIIKYSKNSLSSGKASSPIEGDITSASSTQLKYLSPFIGWAVSEKQWELADKIIDYCEKAKGSIIDLHFFYLSAADCYYRQAKEKPQALDSAICYCKKDIDLFPKYKRPLMKEMGGKLPKIPAFQMLAMCYEKQEKYVEAIEVCNDAIKYGLKDGTVSGFAGRIERIEKKIK